MNTTNLYTGAILGAVAGGALALLDKTTRQKLGNRLKGASGAFQRYKDQPSEAVRDFRESYEKIADDVSKKTEDALNLLTNIQETVEMIDNLTRKDSSNDTSSSDSVK